ncbi:MAG TPA: glutathione transferase, partial [Gammaproteobacteria bacterium]|nr:glutathione transferase [Gammaproteobacteria bacterium]
IWKDNKSEGDSLYFLDPDGHKLEIHVGDLESRLAALREKPYEGLQLFV